MKRTVIVAALAALAAAVLCSKGGVQTKELVKSAITYMESAGDNAMAAYLVFTVFGVIFLVPTTLMEFSGGFLFASRYGLVTTWILTSLAKLVANVIAVWMARNLMRDWVRKTFVEKSELLMMVSEAVRQEPFKMAFLVRGSYLPLSAKNYGLGVLDIPYLQIAMASCVFTPFYAYQNLYMGSACQDLTEIFAGKAAMSVDDGWASYVKKVLPIACNVVLVVVCIRVVKAQLQKQRASVEASLKARTAQERAPQEASGAHEKKED